MIRDEKPFMRMAFDDNLVLMLRGKKCWAWQFLKAMSTIGLINATTLMASAASQKSWQCAKDRRESFATLL
jgi:hypothetical protein